MSSNRKLSQRGGALLAALTLVAACAIASTIIALAIPMPGKDDFNVVDWELRNIPGKWLYLTDRFFTGGLTYDEENARLERFLEVSGEIRSREASFADEPQQVAELQSLTKEQNALENDAEAVIEGRLTQVLKDVGLTSSFPLFPSASWVFPPVDVEFGEPPRSLAISPVVRIELMDRRPLRPGLTLAEAVKREQEAEAAGNVSALVQPLAGASTYPSIVEPVGDYEGLVAIVAHEWVHQYLFFKPLGQRYYNSTELETLNETVADLTGQALAKLVVERYPLPVPAKPAEPAPAPSVDVDAFLRQLRHDVEALLTAGDFDEAAVLMERRRQELADQGVYFRRINQAFFAARGIYATTPGAVDPIGPKLRELLSESTDVGAFLRTASRFTSAADLDAALATSGDTAHQ